MNKTVKCPRCGGPSEYSPSNTHRPFCSERCQLIDLGDWASDKFAVPGEKVDLNNQQEQSTKNDSLKNPNDESE